jgi:hypothetical protein
VAKIPRKLAHPCKLFGRLRIKYKERMKITMAWRTDIATTTRAVRKEGASWSLAGLVVDGVARGKKMRNKRSLHPL